jgi:hypothetical protein
MAMFSGPERGLNLGWYHDDAADVVRQKTLRNDTRSLSLIVDNSVDKLLISCCVKRGIRAQQDVIAMRKPRHEWNIPYD